MKSRLALIAVLLMTFLPVTLASGSTTPAVYLLTAKHCKANYQETDVAVKFLGVKYKLKLCVYLVPVTTPTVSVTQLPSVGDIAPVTDVAPVQDQAPTTTTTLPPVTTTTVPPSIVVSITATNEATHQQVNGSVSPGDYQFVGSFVDTDGSTPTGNWSWNITGPSVVTEPYSPGSFFMGYDISSSGTYIVTATYTTYDPDAAGGIGISGSASFELDVS